jgi:hypothetical protein
MDLNDVIKSDGSFTAWQEGIELTMLKSQPATSPYLAELRGYCSTEKRDRQDEVLLQRGLNFDDFIKYGYFNDNHAQETGAQVGVPKMAEYHPGKGWYTEGYLLKSPRAQKIYDLAKALVGTSRKLGFSVEGKVETREGKTIVKANIRHVAITHCPVNPECTWDLVAKALSAGGSVGGSANGASIYTNGDTDLERDVKLPHENHNHTGHRCKHCRATKRTKKALDLHMQDVHGWRESMKVERDTQIVKGYSREQAVQYIRNLRPNWSDDLISNALSRR